MTVFRINLIRNRPVPLPQRKAVALPLIFYLFVSGLLLAWSINQAVRDVLAVHQRQRQSAADLARFAQQHPHQPDIASYIGALRHQLEDASETLGTTEQLLERRDPAAVILYSLTAPLPRNVRLLSLSLTPADRSLHFELVFPVEGEQDGNQTNTTQLLTIWRTTPEVQSLLSDIREENSQQTEFAGRPSFLVRFAATINGGD